MLPTQNIHPGDTEEFFSHSTHGARFTAMQEGYVDFDRCTDNAVSHFLGKKP